MLRNTRLLSIRHADDTESLGVIVDGGVIDVRAVAARLGITVPTTVDGLLQGDGAHALRRVIDSAGASGVALLAESGIVHGKLFSHPGKIICVGLNYRQHAEEIGVPAPRVPPLFSKFNNALAGHGCVIDLPPPALSTKFDYETELLIVVGRHGRNIPEADALAYVAGYCTANDFSARDLQMELPSSQWMIGKTLDRFAPIGPWFVSADLVEDPNRLTIETRVNGEVRQSSSTADFIFNTQQILAYISRHWALEPGDIIFTGTPQGVIAGLPKDRQEWLKAGDVIESTVGNLGTLRFSLAAGTEAT